MPRRAEQIPLPLPAPPREADQPYLPVRMVNEWVYCPRLAWLMHVEGEWAETEDTVRGQQVHARADTPSGQLAQAEELEQKEDITARIRAITLASDRLGLIAKIDMLDVEEGQVSVIDIKKGKRPHVAKSAYEPERVQVCLQAMILEDNGYKVKDAALWFAGSRERVPVVLDEELRAAALTAVSEMRLAIAAGRRPPPLEHSRKCVRCALAGICLPDETNWFRSQAPPRPLNPADDPALPLYVQTPGARIGKRGEVLVISVDDDKTEVPLVDVSDASLFGPVSITTPALNALLAKGASVAWFSTGGWFHGFATAAHGLSSWVRKRQFQAMFDERRRLAIARRLVEAKIRNQRTLLRRNWRSGRAGASDAQAEAEPLDKAGVMQRLKRLYQRVPHAKNIEELLGLEGEAAAIYFRHFSRMLSPPGEEAGQGGFTFHFSQRNRRPPRDPVNAMLSLAYAMLARMFTAVLTVVGFDPWHGFYHAQRPGRPALALDMMEPYRPVLADSVVITAINNGEVKPSDFVSNGPACNLKPAGRKRFIAVFERRLQQEAMHPLFGYRVSMRRMVEVQMRLFARHLDGEIRDFPHYLLR
jgi:CRISPR-associated exonuclease Cas4/CRISPR-associated protein Cas1